VLALVLWCGCSCWFGVSGARRRLAPILKPRASLGGRAFVFGSEAGAYAERSKRAWESLLLLANGHEQHRLVAHATNPSEDGLDGRVDRLDDAKPHRVIATGGDAVEMREQKLAEAFHFRQPLPAQRLDPAEEEVQHPGAGLVGPEPIELLAQHVRFEPPAIGGEEGFQFPTVRAADRPCSARSVTHALPIVRINGIRESTKSPITRSAGASLSALAAALSRLAPQRSPSIRYSVFDVRVYE
jgi:hypothetical protein